MNSNTPTHFNVYSVEEYETDGGKKRSWLKVGVAFPHRKPAELGAFSRLVAAA